MSTNKILRELQKRVEQAEKSAAAPRLVLEDHLFPKQLDFVKDTSTRKTAVCSRRCLAKGTLIATTLGPKPIEEITTQDWVYDEFGKPVKVANVYNNGLQEVVEIIHNTKVMFKATKNHTVLSYNTYSKTKKDKKLEDFNSRDKIVRNEICREAGLHQENAYAIGALLGDGCSKTKDRNRIYISSEDSRIPGQVAKLLGATKVVKSAGNNYTYAIHLERHLWPEEYLKWCHNKYAHEKVCEVDTILKWSRDSRLAFIAGLIDTDGSVHNAKDGIQIDISMQAKSVIETAQILFLDLWQVSPSIIIDNRSKYKNGPVYVLRLKHNYFGKKILKDLNPYIQTERKNWKSEYEKKTENNYRPDYVGIKFGKTSIEQTFDIHVASSTNLYMLANGLITHNSGKTESCAADLLFTCLTEPNVNCLYITLTRTSAKRIIWNTIRKLLNEYKIEVSRIDNTELSIEFKNGSTLYISGAKDSSEIERFRGMSLRKVYIDECFHGDTLVQTPKGEVKISDLKVGDKILNCTGIDTVIEVSKKQKDKYLEITYNNKIVKCSENHPFFTRQGWKRAIELKVGDELINDTTSMYLLQQDFSKTGETNLQVLQQLLLREMGTKKQAKSCPLPRSSEKNITNFKTNEASPPYSTRKWPRTYQAGIHIISTVSRIAVELCHRFGKINSRISEKLQSRFSVCRFKISHRSGWELALLSGKTTTRFEKNYEIKFSRVESIESKESGSDRTNPEGIFYDIGVENHPSFFVNGVLVHNCQSFRAYIKELIDDVIDPATWDVDGTICLLGTPGPVPAGFFYDITHGSGWSNHKWTIFDNPFIKLKSKKDPEQILEQTLKQRGVGKDDPSVQREFFGQWTADTNSLVYRFNKHINTTVELPTDLMYIFGIDLGFNDADAIAVLGYSMRMNKVYLVEEFVKNKQGITELVNEIERLKQKYGPVKMVMDAGALGKKIQEEIRVRHGVPIEAADKARKLEFIELLNDDLRTQRFMSVVGTRFEEDCNLVQWDREDPTKPKISDAYHSDICDAVLYAWRECKHYIAHAEPAKLDKNSDAFMDALEAKEAAELEERLHGDDGMGVDNEDLNSIYDTWDN